MAPRRPIADDDDVNLDDVETVRHDDDDTPQPGDDDPEIIEVEDELEPDEPDEPEDDALAARRRELARNGQQPPATTRGARRAQTLANENRALRDQLSELKGRFDQFATDQSRTTAPAQPRETPEQRAQRRALMSDREIIEEDMQSLRSELTGSVNMTRGQLADQADRSAFDTLINSDPFYKRFVPEVEKMLGDLHRHNQSASRDVLLDIAIGRWNRAQRNSPEAKRKIAAARERVRRQTTRPGNNASDAGGGGRRRGGTSLEDRLADQPL